MKKLRYILPFLLIVGYVSYCWQFRQNLHADTVTSGSVGLVQISTKTIDLKKSWGDKVNDNFAVIASTMNDIRNKFNAIVSTNITDVNISTNAGAVNTIQTTSSSVWMPLDASTPTKLGGLAINGQINGTIIDSSVTRRGQLNDGLQNVILSSMSSSNISVSSMNMNGSSITYNTSGVPITIVFPSTLPVVGQKTGVESINGRVVTLNFSNDAAGGGGGGGGLTTETTIQYCLCGGPGELFASTIPFKLAKPFVTGNSSYTLINAVAFGATLSTHPITFGVGISTEINANSNFPAIQSSSFVLQANQMWGATFTNFDSTSATTLNAYQKMSLFISTVTPASDLPTGGWGVLFEMKRRSN